MLKDPHRPRVGEVLEDPTDPGWLRPPSLVLEPRLFPWEAALPLHVVSLSCAAGPAEAGGCQSSSLPGQGLQQTCLSTG